MSFHSAIAATAKGAIEEIRVPSTTPGEGQVLIKVAFASLIAIDTYVTDRGLYVPEYPMILGFNASGTIEQLGPGVANLKVGDRVTTFGYGKSQRKTMQTYSVQSESVVAKIPDSLDLDAAATVPDNFVTAFYTIFNQLSLPIPSTFPPAAPPPLNSTPILIYGAGSTAGLYAVQLLHLAGYKKIIATASPKHHEYIRSLGAMYTFDYRSLTLADDVQKVVGGDGKVLLAVDCITTESTLQTISKLVGPFSKVAILLPIKEGDAVTNALHQDIYIDLPDEKNPFNKRTEIIPVRTFNYQQDEVLKNTLMSKILPELLERGYIQPNRVRLMDKGTFKERVGTGLDLLRKNEVSGEKVIVKVIDCL